MKQNRVTFAACLALAAAAACQGPPPGPDGVIAGAMPQDPRQPLTDLKKARFDAAVEGIAFEDGFVVVVAPTGEDHAAAAAHHTEGLTRLRGNRRTGALAALTLAVRADPQWAEAYHGLGKALQAKGKDEHALAAFRTAVSLDPGYTQAQYEVASTLSGMGQRQEAIEQMRLVLETDPGNAAAHERLAIWYYYEHDAVAAWRHVHAARDLGREPPPQFLARLHGQMPEPQRP